MWPRGDGDGDGDGDGAGASAGASSAGAADRSRRAKRGGGGGRQQAADDGDERVYRPLLFQSKGYASSELFRDTYEMRVRMQAGDASGADGGSSAGVGGGDWQMQKAGGSLHGPRNGVGRPRIRLETLSSRAATTVLSITYLSFLLALVLPYLQSQGYLETVGGPFLLHDQYFRRLED